ncbi:MAG: PqqD family protein [Alphaproteobacteria bacterium]
MRDETRIGKAGNLLSADLADETVIMNIRTGNYFGLDDIATEIFQHLAEPMAVAELCRRLETEFDAAPETIRNDVLPLLEQMLEYGLIEVMP